MGSELNEMKEMSKVPKIPHAFFRWYCKPDRYEELHGDLEEFYYERIETHGTSKARWWYTWEVLTCCQPYAWKSTRSPLNPNVIMFKNYYKTSMRSLMKSPLNSFINLFGLSVAIGICVLVYGFAQWTYRTDQFHEHKNEVFLVTFLADRDGTMQQIGQSPRPLGKMLANDFSGVKHMCRVEDRNVVMKMDDKVFHERVRLTDQTFLDMFTFPLKWGTGESLSGVSSIILSEPMSIKYFGGANPIGQELTIIFSEGKNKSFTVTGVAAPFPKSRTIDFDFLINFENLKWAYPAYDPDDWKQLLSATLIQVDDASHIGQIEQGMDKYRKLQNGIASDWVIEGFVFEPLATLHQRSGDIRNDISWSSKDNYTSIVFLAVIAIFMLTLACFNYINIAIVSAARRLKEIGIRKSIGATRRMVFVQFLAENILLTAFALLIGLALGMHVFIPWFEQIADFNMDFRLLDLDLWIYLPVILLLTGISSGIYPALYISRFQVTGILKGTIKFGQKSLLTRVLLGVQLILACILITSAIIFTQNTAYLAKRDWGYAQEHVLYAEVPDQQHFDQLQAAIAQLPDVLSVSGSQHHVGRNHETTVINMPDRQYEVDQLVVGIDYFKTMDIPMQSGRTFEEGRGGDHHAVVVNELLVDHLDLENAIGSVLKMDTARYTIIGVVQNFHSYSFSNYMKPTLFVMAQPDEYRFLSIKTREGMKAKTYQGLQEQWVSLFPEIPFLGGHQEDVWGGYFDQIGVHGKFWRGIALIAVILASLGLFGLVTLNVTGRIKEFSIRKVLGAQIRNITLNVGQQYLPLFVIALTVAAPVSYLLLDFILDFAYEYHMPMSLMGVVMAVGLLILVLVAVVSIQVRKVLKFNPASGLRVE